MPLVLIDRTAGTNFGDLTGGGGLAAAFDGGTSESDLNCANRSGAAGYVGKTLASPKKFGQAKTYGSNNVGYIGNSNPSVTITVYGKTGTAPANGTNGTSIGSITFTDTTNENAGRTITSTDTTTSWDHIWIYILHSGASIRVAELELWEEITGTDIVGSSAGTATAAATSATLRSMVGTAAGVATALANSTVGATTGVSAGIATAAAVARTLREMVGTIAGLATASAIGVTLKSMVGAIAGISTATGFSIVGSTGTAAGTSTAEAISSSLGGSIGGISVFFNGQYRAGTIYVNRNGAWVQPVSVWGKIGGVWRQSV